MLGQEEQTGIGARIGAIEGVLIPDNPKFQLQQGGFVYLTIRVQNTGGIPITPWVRIQVKESGFWGSGPLIKEILFQDSTRQPGDIATYTRGFIDDGPTEGRDVFIHIGPTSDLGDGKTYTGGADHWAGAYDVVSPLVAGVSVLDLELKGSLF